jgi:hypothetical protein
MGEWAFKAVRPMRFGCWAEPDNRMSIVGHYFFYFFFFFFPILGNRFLTAAFTFFRSAAVPL